MSANIYWKPAATEKNYLAIGSPTKFRALMEQLLGNEAPLLTRHSVPVLKMLVSVYQTLDDREYECAIQALIDAIEAVGAIQLVIEF